MRAVSSNFSETAPNALAPRDLKGPGELAIRVSEAVPPNFPLNEDSRDPSRERSHAVIVIVASSN